MICKYRKLFGGCKYFKRRCCVRGCKKYYAKVKKQKQLKRLKAFRKVG